MKGDRLFHVRLLGPDMSIDGIRSKYDEVKFRFIYECPDSEEAYIELNLDACDLAAIRRAIALLDAAAEKDPE